MKTDGELRVIGVYTVVKANLHRHFLFLFQLELVPFEVKVTDASNSPFLWSLARIHLNFGEEWKYRTNETICHFQPASAWPSAGTMLEPHESAPGRAPAGAQSGVRARPVSTDFRMRIPHRPLRDQRSF